MNFSIETGIAEIDSDSNNDGIIDEDVTIGNNVVIGVEKGHSTGISVIGRDTVIPDDEVIKDNQNIEADYRKEIK